MAMEQTSKTMEQIEEDNRNLEKTANDVMAKIQGDSVFKSLELPVEEVVEQQESQEVEEPQEEVQDVQEEVTEQAEEQVEEETDEELIPKSKVQRRFDELTARIKQLESEKETLQPKPTDEITKKLEAMSETELRDLRKQVRASQVKEANNDDRLAELVELEDKIEGTLRAAPQRFIQAQVEKFNKAATTIEHELSDSGIDVTKAAPQIINAAKEIYASYPKLQKDVDGQAIALELAAKHFKEVVRLTKTPNKDTVSNLKQQVNTLKKKTALDTKTAKGNTEVNKEQLLRRRAMNGTMQDKRDFVKNSILFNIDSQIPDEYKR